MDTESKKIRIGYICAEKKKKPLFIPLEKYIEENVEGISLEHATETSEIDFLVHKLTNELANPKSSKTTSDLKVLEHFEKKGIPIFESREKLTQLLNREQMYLTLKKSGVVKSPVYFVKLLKDIEKSKVDYPVIVKRISACGSSSAHTMAVVFHENGWPTDFQDDEKVVVQEYINHDATIYKLYVLEDDLWVHKRDSFPNFVEKHEPIVFHTQKLPIKKKYGKPGEFVDSKVAHDMFDDVILEVRRLFDIDLIGIDIIIKSNTKDMYVLDLNYFPSYENTSDNRFELISRYFQRQYEKRTKNA